MDGGPGEALDDAVELEAAIEAVGEAGEVGLRMLCADVVVGASERGFDVAQAGIDPLERRPARGPLAGTGRHREVLAAGLLDRRPAGQAVADDIAPGSEVSFGQPFHLLLAEALDHAQPQPPRPTLGRGLDRGDDRRLACGTAAALAARALAAEVGVVDLDPARELGLVSLARAHRPHQLVLDQPRCLPLDPEPSRELDRADPVLALGEVVDRREPGGERQLGVLEHGAGGQPHLLLAPVALKQLARLERAQATVAAGRAGEPVAPAHVEECLPAGLLGTEALSELDLAQALKRTPQPLCRCHPRSPQAPKAAETLAQLRMRVMGNQVRQCPPDLIYALHTDPPQSRDEVDAMLKAEEYKGSLDSLLGR